EVDEQQRGGAVEVAAPGGDLHPVGAEGHGPQRLPADVDQQVPTHQAGDGHADHHDRDQGGQQPAGPPQPELRQVDPPAGADLPQQQSGDEEAGDDEEDVDAEEPGRQHGGGEVEDQHPDDGQCADAVQAVDVARPGVHLPGAARALAAP